MNSDEGHILNLSADQKKHLAQLWAAVYWVLLPSEDASLLELLKDGELRAYVESTRSDLLKPTFGRQDTASSGKSRSWNPFSRSSTASTESLATSGLASRVSLDVTDYAADHGSLLNELHRSLGTEHPDVLLLRFLRARKWDIAKALEMLLKATKWRQKAGVNEFMRDSERLVGEGVLKSGKAYVQGRDLSGRPISISHVALHDPKAQPLLETQRFCIYTIETSRLLLSPPNETATILFDFRGFGLRNMDNEFTKYLIGALEAYYPESLGLCLMLEAPAVFRGLWAVIKGWLDPVVAAKVKFVKTSELPEHIDPIFILPGMDGDSGFKYVYSKGSYPVRAPPDDAEIKATGAFSAACSRLDGVTISWLKSVLSGSEDEKLAKEREAIVEEVKKRVEEARAWWIGETWYHRNGYITSACWRG